jgi:hypothetical protein
MTILFFTSIDPIRMGENSGDVADAFFTAVFDGAGTVICL